MEGVVKEYKQNQSGRTKVKIDSGHGGQWYNCGNGVDMTGAPVGSHITFDASQGQPFQGHEVWWLNKWALKTDSTPATNGSAPISQQRNVMAPAAPPPQKAMFAVPAQAPVDEPTLRAVSNVLGSAIGAGYIQKPQDLDPWAKAAYWAVHTLTSPPKSMDPYAPIDEASYEKSFADLPPGATDAREKATEIPWD